MQAPPHGLITQPDVVNQLLDYCGSQFKVIQEMIQLNESILVIHFEAVCHEVGFPKSVPKSTSDRMGYSKKVATVILLWPICKRP